MTGKPPLEDQIKVASESLRALGIFVDTLQSRSKEISREYLLLREQLSPISEDAAALNVGRASSLLKMIEDEARSMNDLRRLIAGHCQDLRRNVRKMVVADEQE